MALLEMMGLPTTRDDSEDVEPTEEEGDISSEMQENAADDLAKAMQGGDKAAMVDAFKTLLDLLKEDE